MSLVRGLTSLERTATNLAARLLELSMRVLTRVLGRGKHRAWRKRAQAEVLRRTRS